MFFTVTKRVVDCSVEQRCRTDVVPEVFLDLGDPSVSLRLAIVQVVVRGIVCETSLMQLNVVFV
jgi:hypothetical protein